MTNIKRERSVAEIAGYLAPGKSSSWIQSVQCMIDKN